MFPLPFHSRAHLTADRESHKILGTTFGMLVLQDFESITPNVLARTIETVQGGGCVLLLLKVHPVGGEGTEAGHAS